MRMRRDLLLLVALFFVANAKPLFAQSDRIPTAAWAFGWSPAAGLIGLEVVARSFGAAQHLGGAAGIGIGGLGLRVNLAMRNPNAHHRIPYLGVGYAATPWLPTIRLKSLTSIEGGVQIWPTGQSRLYMDFGAGVAFLTGASEEIGPVLRLLFGRTL